MTNTEWAAWVQAIGSIVAIGIAIAVPWWQTRVARQDQKVERNKRASALLLGLYPEIMEIRYSISELRARIDQHPPIAGVTSLLDLLRIARLPPTPNMHNSIHDGVHFDAEQCAAYHKLIWQILRYEEAIADYRERHSLQLPRDPDTIRRNLIGSLDVMELVAEDAKRSFDEMHLAIRPNVQKLLKREDD